MKTSPLGENALNLAVPAVAAASPTDDLTSEPIIIPATKTTPVQIVFIALGMMAFLYVARPVILPILVACVAGMTLKPLIRWSSYCHIPPALSAAVVISLLITGVVMGFVQFGRPALT